MSLRMKTKTRNRFVDEGRVDIITVVRDELPPLMTMSIILQGERARAQARRPRRVYFPAFILHMCSVRKGSG
jgi:hypothetical protein